MTLESVFYSIAIIYMVGMMGIFITATVLLYKGLQHMKESIERIENRVTDSLDSISNFRNTIIPSIPVVATVINLLRRRKK